MYTDYSSIGPLGTTSKREILALLGRSGGRLGIINLLLRTVGSGTR